MATFDRPPPNRDAQPAGVEGDGMDPYPTYRDGPTTPHRATATKPTDVGLPRSRRTYGLPIFIGLVVFALVIVIRLLWGGINTSAPSGDAMTPAEPTAPTATAPASPQTPTSETDAPEAAGALDADVQPQTSAGPGEVEEVPGPADVPGGETTTPVEPAPAQ